MPDPTVDPARFRQVLGHFPTGITVIASEHDGQRVGLAVGSFFSVSLDPPLVGFCVGSQSSSWPRIRAAGRFCVNVLGAHQEDVCRVFAGKGEDKFAGIGYDAAPWSGAPRLHDAVAWIDCELAEVLPGGDHDIVLGRVHDLAVADEGHPLVFYRGGYASLER
ncbi:MAG TPA: flavin reductase family protein [Acidimicrobiales bacterium]|nr:flavin reductase family protein [Acidimicrobiales bacterium]